MNLCNLSIDEMVRRKLLTDHTREMIRSVLAVVAEDDTSIMTVYRDFYLQISFSELHPLMVFCIARPVDGSADSLEKQTNEMNLRSILGSHCVNENFGFYSFRSTHWLDSELEPGRFLEILDRCIDEAAHGYQHLLDKIA